VSSRHTGTASSSRSALIIAVSLWIGLPGIAPANDVGDAVTLLPKPVLNGSMSVEYALAHRRSIRDFDPAALPLAAVSQLLWAAQGVTNERGFRTTPSAGALFPLEIYLVAGAVTGLTPGIYHYEPQRHRLMRISTGDFRDALTDSAHGQDWMKEAPAVLVLAAKVSRTARKYGRRAGRYVQMEAGYAGQNVYLQSQALELGTCMVGAFSDEKVKALVRMPTGVRPLGLMPVGRRQGLEGASKSSHDDPSS
jgi:SagB-type dehydrogenase family enzyme